MNGNNLLKKRLNKLEREILIHLGVKLMDLLYVDISEYTSPANNVKTYYVQNNKDVTFLYFKKDKKLSITQNTIDTFIRIYPISVDNFKDILKHWFTQKYNTTIRYITIVDDVN